MKLLLTSGGVMNKSIEGCLIDALGKDPKESSVAFIITASSAIAYDKSWVIKDLSKLVDMGFKHIDIVDISAVDKTNWLPRLQNVDVIFVEGGDTFYLMEWITKSGLRDEIDVLLKETVYVGVSAGSCIFSENLALKASQEVYGEDLERKDDLLGLNYLNFYIFPHFNNKTYFPKVTKENLEKFKAIYKKDMYLLDDNSALFFDGQNTKIISEGEWCKL